MPEFIYSLPVDPMDSTSVQQVKAKLILLTQNDHLDFSGDILLADKIIALAREHDIPVHEDSDLAEILSRLDLFEEIPPSTYLMVAEILAFVYRANSKYNPGT